MTMNMSSRYDGLSSFQKRYLWKIINATLFRILTPVWRRKLLCCFGASIRPCHIYGSVKIYAPWNLTIGEWVCIGPRVEIYNKAPINIGSHTVLSQDSYICTASHDISSPNMADVNKQINIGSNVWIAAKSAVMPGVTIADGTVVAACAVVTKSTEPWTLVGGNPAKYIKKRELNVINAKA